MVGMPGCADIVFLIRILAHLGNDRMRLNRLKKPVYIDFTPTPGKLDVLIGCYFLVSKKYNAELDKGLAYFGKLFVAYAGCDIGTANLCTHLPAYRYYPYGFEFGLHKSLGNLPAPRFA
jgi:hypothetical protein